jgi:uncharacterized protein with GYD domain
MKTFVLVTKLAAADARPIEIGAKHRDRERSSNAWLKEVARRCPMIEFKAHYALMGYWDSMHIYDAPDEEVAALVSLLAREHGAAQVESWLAMPYDRIMKMAQDIEKSEEPGE